VNEVDQIRSTGQGKVGTNRCGNFECRPLPRISSSGTEEINRIQPASKVREPLVAREIFVVGQKCRNSLLRCVYSCGSGLLKQQKRVGPAYAEIIAVLPRNKEIKVNCHVMAADVWPEAAEIMRRKRSGVSHAGPSKCWPAVIY
jgi:hypothetical protein